MLSTGAVRNVRVLGGVSGAELRAVLLADADSIRIDDSRLDDVHFLNGVHLYHLE